VGNKSLLSNMVGLTPKCKYLERVIMAEIIIPDNEIRQVLASLPEVLALFNTARSHFGAKLTCVRQIQGIQTSQIEPVPNLPRPVLTGFKAVIQIDSSRVASHIAHEFLHLKLYMEGFPWCQYPETNHREVDEPLYDTQQRILNAVQHLIFFENFIGMGFPWKDFLEGVTFPREQVLSCSDILKIWMSPYKTIAIGLWNFGFLDEYIAGQFGFPNHSEDLVIRAKEMPFPAGGEVAFMREWVKRGDYKNKGTYAGAVNELMVKIGFPKAEFIPLDF
jgi:hypothetical protein